METGEPKVRLYHSPNSPYVRKVMVTVAELDLGDRIEVCSTDVWDADSPIGRVNPLGRIPTLETDDGETLYDSPVICEYLDSEFGGRRFLPSSGPERWRVLRLQALGDGLIDASVLIVLELRRRPAELRWTAWVDRQRAAMRRVLDDLERHAPKFGTGLDLGKIAVGCALGYVDARFAEDDWREGRPALADWFGRVSLRPSMRDSAPVS